MRITLVLTFFFILPVYSWAQFFYGYILDQNSHKPIEAVSVSIIDEEGRALCYTIAEDNGYFQITCNNKAGKYIYFSCLNYKSNSIDVTNLKNGSQVFLERSLIELKEVEVRYQPIRQTGDTLNYDVRGFRLAQDQHIKDILKRLPGIEIAENGKIKYEGKEINKFYVENLDLTDGKYNIITNNLSAKSVKTVQVFENHQPISALHGADFSEKAALNLLLEDDIKGKLIGIIDLGSGLENSLNAPLWENRFMELIFGSKIQNISIYKNSNTGNDIKEDLIDFGTGRAYVTDVFSSMANESDIFMPLGKEESLSFNKKHYFFNKTHYFSTSSLIQIAKNNQLRLQTSYLNEKETQNSYSSTLYLFPNNNNILVSEDKKAKDLTNKIEGRVSYESNTEKTFIKNSIDANVLFKSNDAKINGSEKVRQETKTDRISLSNDFSFIHKYNENKIIRFNSINRYNRLPQKIDIFPGLYQEFTGDSIINEHMVQKGTLQSLNSNSYTSFSHPLSVFAVDYKLGVNINTQLLKTMPSNTTSSLLNSYSDSLDNHYRFTETNLYLSPTLKFQREYLNISFALNSALRYFYSHDFLSDSTKQNKTVLLIQPSFQVNYEIDAYWKIGVYSNYKRSYTDIHSLYHGYILKSYRNILNYNNNIDYTASVNNDILISYKQPIKGFFANISSSYSLLKKNNLTKTSFNGIFQQNSTINKKITDNNFNIFVNMSKTLPFISSVANFKYYLIGYNYSQFLNDILTKNNTVTHNFDLSFTLAPIKIINIEGKGNFSFSRMKTVSPSPQKYTPVRNYKFGLAANLTPSKEITFSWDNELNYNYIQDIQIVYFSNILISYLLKKSEIRFYVNNIFNETKYEKRVLGHFSESYNISLLHERQFLIKYSFNW